MKKTKKIIKNKKVARKTNKLFKSKKPVEHSKLKPHNECQVGTVIRKRRSRTVDGEKKPSIEKMYFTSDTEDAIVNYNNETNQLKREAIYNEKIKYPFEKLVENIFNTFKFTYFGVGPEDVQRETLSHLASNIHKYKKEKGKAYSYFSIIAKNYLIFHNNLNFKHYKMHSEITDEQEEGAIVLKTEDSYHGDTENKEFLNLMIKYWDENITKIFKKQKDINIAQAVIELFRNSDKIDSFNKKALYLYIREISSCHTQQITKIINKMKIYQNQISKNYLNSGMIN